MLLPVVLLITLVAVAAFSVTQLGSVEIRAVTSQAEARQAERLAQSGLEHAEWLMQNSGCGGDLTLASSPLGADAYNASVTTGTGSTVYTLSVDQDAWIRESAPTANYGLDTELSAKNQAADSMRALYRFDLAAIPAGSTIGSATVWLYATTGDDQGPVSVHRVTADWAEGDATWTSVGERFDGQALAVIPAQSDNGVWIKLNLTAHVQAWVNGAQPNYGIMLIASSDALLSTYASREWSTVDERPRLEVVTVSGAASPASVAATGTLESGVSRSLTREAVTVYQPASTFVWQPGPELEDAYIRDGAYKSKNFGISPILNLSTGRNVLIRFALDSLPPGARIADARLELYLQDGTGVSNGVLDLHAIRRGWVEGIYDDGRPGPGEGVTYDEYDGGNPWTTPGGDYDATVIDSVSLPTASPGWYAWNVSRQVQAWRDGAPNYGFLLREGGGTVGDINFLSSDDATSPQYHPRLTVTVRCECGVACLLPQGSGNVLLIVADAANMTASERALQSTFESWGYAVTPLSDDATQAVYDTNLGSHNVVYVSQTASSAAVGTKLTSAPIGVVSEQGDLNAELGIAAGSATAVGASVDVTSSSHYITAPFGAGSLPIYSAPMEGVTVSGTPAPGSEILASWGGAGTLVALEQGMETSGGGPAAGRRVTLPLGRAAAAKFDWDYLNANGQLIVQRALQWGTGNTEGGGEPFVCDGTYLDSFDSQDWEGDDGSITPWANPWLEVGESDGANQGDVQVAADESNYQLQIRDNDNGGEGVEREVDLSGATTATLSFDYRREALDDSDDYVAVYVSATGTGGPWTEIARIAGGSNDASYQTSSHDISGHISSQTAIRLRSSPSMGVMDRVWFDNVQVECVP
ncbi:MAG: DNRLRE domain-containing protein [Gammaproteobacteria bacterium]